MKRKKKHRKNNNNNKPYGKTTQTTETLCLSAKNKASVGKGKPRETVKSGLQGVCRGRTGLDSISPTGHV